MNEGDAFEAYINRALGPVVIDDDCVAERLWSSLTNTVWRRSSGEAILYSFRSAGDLIAAIRGSGDYMDWYCCAPAGRVDGDIRAIMALDGWAPEPAVVPAVPRAAEIL